MTPPSVRGELTPWPDRTPTASTSRRALRGSGCGCGQASGGPACSDGGNAGTAGTTPADRCWSSARSMWVPTRPRGPRAGLCGARTPALTGRCTTWSLRAGRRGCCRCRPGILSCSRRAESDGVRCPHPANEIGSRRDATAQAGPSSSLEGLQLVRQCNQRSEAGPSSPLEGLQRTPPPAEPPADDRSVLDW